MLWLLLQLILLKVLDVLNEMGDFFLHNLHHLNIINYVKVENTYAWIIATAGNNARVPQDICVS